MANRTKQYGYAHHRQYIVEGVLVEPAEKLPRSMEHLLERQFAVIVPALAHMGDKALGIVHPKTPAGG